MKSIANSLPTALGGRADFVDQGSLNDRDEAFKFYEMDLGDEVKLRHVIATEKPQAVIHFAGVAYAGESAEDPLKYYHNNTMNTIKLAEAMMSYGVHNLIFSSSCSTYGSPSKMPVTEETPQNPVSPYGWSKLHAEQVLRDLWKSPSATQSPFRVALLRYFNVIGADPKGRLGERNPRGLKPGTKEYQEEVRISTALFDAAEARSSMFTVAGDKYNTPDGTALRDYIHVSDLANAHIDALDSITKNATLPTLRYYNVGTGKPSSVLDLIRAVKAVTGVNFSVEIGDARATDPPKVWADNSKIKMELGWEPKYVNLTETLEHTWNFRRTARAPLSVPRGQTKLDTFVRVESSNSDGLWEGQAVINDESGLTPLTLRSLYHSPVLKIKTGVQVLMK